MTDHLEIALENFYNKNVLQDTDALNEILKILAKSGEIHSFKWAYVKELIKFKIHQIALKDDSNWIYCGEDRIHPIVQRIEKYLSFLEQAPPFTFQRICELILHPEQYRTERTLMMIEKCLKGITITTDCYKETSEETPSVTESLEMEMMAMDT